MSLILEFGHHAAMQYPLARVWTEARIIRERQAGRRQMEAAVIQMAVASIFDGKAGKRFQGFMANLKACD